MNTKIDITLRTMIYVVTRLIAILITSLSLSIFNGDWQKNNMIIEKLSRRLVRVTGGRRRAFHQDLSRAIKLISDNY